MFARCAADSNKYPPTLDKIFANGKRVLTPAWSVSTGNQEWSRSVGWSRDTYIWGEGVEKHTTYSTTRSGRRNMISMGYRGNSLTSMQSTGVCVVNLCKECHNSLTAKTAKEAWLPKFSLRVRQYSRRRIAKDDGCWRHLVCNSLTSMQSTSTAMVELLLSVSFSRGTVP